MAHFWKNMEMAFNEQFGIYHKMKEQKLNFGANEMIGFINPRPSVVISVPKAGQPNRRKIS